MARLNPRELAREAIKGYRVYLRAKGLTDAEAEYWIKRVARGFDDQHLDATLKARKLEQGR